MDAGVSLRAGVASEAQSVVAGVARSGIRGVGSRMSRPSSCVGVVGAVAATMVLVLVLTVLVEEALVLVLVEEALVLVLVWVPFVVAASARRGRVPG